jgi:hypothetical protein
VPERRAQPPAMTEEEAAGIARFGDLIRYAPAIQKLAAS